jgi:hypothetical protein
MRLGTSSVAILLLAAPVGACSAEPLSEAMPAGVTANTGTPSVENRVRPALTGDPLSYTLPDLMKRGYPLRPDPVSAPEAYETWLTKVSKPATLITPIIVPTKAHNTVMMSDPNWSGIINNSGGAYSIVTGRWNVPEVPGYPDEDTSSSTWVGIDGSDTTSSLWQVGTTQSADKGQPAEYSAWYELVGPVIKKQQIYRGTDSSGRIVNFPVNPGDEIGAGIAILGDDGSPTPFGSQLWYYMDNDTQAVTVGWIQADVPSDTVAAAHFQGAFAEWIVERPAYPDPFSPLGIGLYPLAPYGQIHFSNMFDFVDGQWDSAPIHDDTIKEDMVNDDGDTLSRVDNNDASSFDATFVMSK